jgi:hypothetical protein
VQTARAYPDNIKLFTSPFLSRNTILKLHKTPIRRILTCGPETWRTTTEEMKALRIFERKIIRKIYKCTRKRRIKQKNKNKQGDKGHIAGKRYCNIYKIPPTER